MITALLSNPLPPEYPPPARLVHFLVKCLDRLLLSPSVERIRPVYAVVSNGHTHLALHLMGDWSLAFARHISQILTGLVSLDTRLAVYLTYGLAALAHIYLVPHDRFPGHPQDHQHLLGTISELFEGAQAPIVLNVVISTAYHLASADTPGHWQDKVEVFRLATEVANAIGGAVKARAVVAAAVDKLHLLLEKSLLHRSHYMIAGIIQFVSAFATVSPPPPLSRVLCQIVCRKDPVAGKVMYLPSFSVDFFAQNPFLGLTGDMLHSLLGSAFLPAGDCSRLYYLDVQERVQFTKQLTKAVPRFPGLWRTLMCTLSSETFNSSIAGLLPPNDSNNGPPAIGRDSCGSGGACVWAVLGIKHRLRLAVCTFILTCSLHARATDGARTAPATAMAFIKKLTGRTATVQQQPAQPPPISAVFQNWAQSSASSTRLTDLVRHHCVVSTIAADELARDIRDQFVTAERVEILAREFEDTRQSYLEELKVVADGADKMATETAADLQAMRQSVGELNVRNLELELEVAELKDQCAKFREDHVSLGLLVESLRSDLAGTRKELGGNGDDGGGRVAPALSDGPTASKRACVEEASTGTVPHADEKLDLGDKQKVHHPLLIFPSFETAVQSRICFRPRSRLKAREIEILFSLFVPPQYEANQLSLGTKRLA